MRDNDYFLYAEELLIQQTVPVRHASLASHSEQTPERYRRLKMSQHEAEYIQVSLF